MPSVVWSLWKPFLFPRTIYAWHVYILPNTLTVCALGPFCLYYARDKAFQMWQMMGISRCFQTLRRPCRHLWSLCYNFSLRDLVYIPDFSATCLFKSHVPFSLFFSSVIIIHQTESMGKHNLLLCDDIKISSLQERILERHVWLTRWPISHTYLTPLWLNISIQSVLFRETPQFWENASRGYPHVFICVMDKSGTHILHFPSFWLHRLSSPWENKSWIWWACAWDTD